MPLTHRLSCLSIAGLLVLLAVPALAQSFNCHKAFYADEKTICGERGLSRLDSELATLFGDVSSRLPAAQRATLQRRETGWVVARRRCGKDPGCIAGFYERRIQQLDAMLAANEPEGTGRMGRPSLQTRASLEPAYHEPDLPAPPAIASTKRLRPSGNERSATAASGSAIPATPSGNFSIEPEVSPGAGAGGPMTPAH